MRNLMMLFWVPAALALIGCKNPLIEGRMAAFEDPEEPEFTVQVENKAGGAVKITPVKESYRTNEQIVIEAVADGGYEFKEWKGNVTGTDNPIIVKVAENILIIPQFEMKTSYRLITEWSPLGGALYYDYGDGIFGADARKKNFLPGEQCAVRAVPAAGYLFEGWEGDIETGNDTIYITFDKDYQVYPKFTVIPTLITHTIKGFTDAGGVIEFYPAKDFYYDNEMVLVAAKPNEGYAFKGWQGGVTGTMNPLIVRVTEDMWIIPKFEAALTYRLTTEWSPVGGTLYYSYDGIFDTLIKKTYFLPGEQCAVRAVPAPGYQFDGWEGDIESANDTVYIKFDRDYQVYGKFSIIPTPVTYTITGGELTGGAVEYFPAKSEYYENEIVLVTAKPDSGYMFAQWNGDHTGSGASFNLTMDSNKNLNAAFMKREWTFFIYMAADNDLDGAALSDFNELEAVDYSGRPVTVLVLFDRINGSPGNWSDTRLYEIKTDPSGENAVIISTRLSGTPELNISSGSGSELDTANRQVLSGFIDYGKRVYKADNYGLIVWGYGLGWKGCAIDMTSGASMSLSALRNGVEEKGLKVIAFDTGFGVTLESSYELRNNAQYLVGSPGTVSDPQKGWDYRKLFSDFLEKPSKTDKVFSNCVVEQYKQQYEASSGAGISIVELSKVQSLFSVFEDYSGTLAASLDSVSARNLLSGKLINSTIRMYHDASQYPADAYADLYSLSLQGSGSTLQNGLNNAVSSWSQEFGTARPLIGVFVNELANSAVFSSNHIAGYLKNQGTILMVADSNKYVPTGSTTGTSLLDKLFYCTY